MVTLSKPISASQARAYHRDEFQNARENYYTEGDKIRGDWHGRLAAKWGLGGAVSEKHFARLAEGQHPQTGEQLVRYQAAREYTNDTGETVKAVEHRAGWDATFSAPKSVSLTALVGHDDRVRDAHRRSVNVALDEMEKYAQARMGGNAPAVTTGEWAAAKFEHDSSRPVDGYVAPQLHTHVVFFNITELENGETRALQPRELYRTQQYATAVYRSELAVRLRDLGYEIEAGASGAPEIRGYSAEYLEASSPRSQQIKEYLAENGFTGAGPAEIAAHQTRDAKLALSKQETLAQHREMAEAFGNQADRIVEAARAKMHSLDRSLDRDDGRFRHAQSAVTFARDRNLEREAVVDERALVRDALKRSMGHASFEEVRRHFEERVEQGDLIEVKRGAMRSLTTPEMIDLERDNIERMRAGQGRFRPLVPEHNTFENLSNCQREAVEEVLESRDQITGLQGAAGAGKTTSLAALRYAAEKEGYTVEGFAPTSRAAYQLEEAGIRATTLQHHLARGESIHDPSGKHLYFVDESSLASTRQIHEFFKRLEENERVVLVGDARQHQAVDAGRPFEQLQDAGMRTARLDEIVRQKDPALKETVEQLARGEVREAIARLDEQGRVHQIGDRDNRVREIAREYVRQPERTLVISPDNKSRMELNRVIHAELQERGAVSSKGHTFQVLTPRQDMTGADRAWAAQYAPGDVVRYSKGSRRTMGIDAGEYVKVAVVDTERNQITVERENGERLSYDPRRLQGVTVYRESERSFSEGDRVQFTAPDKTRKVANRELGTIASMDERGNLAVKLDSGREVRINLEDNRHLDYGYAVTSHSSQGATADRVLVNVDTEEAHEKLINSRLAYVAVSRARYDAQIYTNDAGNLGKALSREVSHAAALDDWKNDIAGWNGSRGGSPSHSVSEQGCSHRGPGQDIAIER